MERAHIAERSLQLHARHQMLFTSQSPNCHQHQHCDQQSKKLLPTLLGVWCFLLPLLLLAVGYTCGGVCLHHNRLRFIAFQIQERTYETGTIHRNTGG